MAINRNTTFINDGAKKTSSNYASTPNTIKPTPNTMVMGKEYYTAAGSGAVNSAINAATTASNTRNDVYKPSATPSSPTGYVPAGNGGTGNAPKVPTPEKQTTEQRITAETGIKPETTKHNVQDGVSTEKLNSGNTTEGNTETTTGTTTGSTSSETTDGSGTTPPPEDVVASIIAAASSSNGMTDTVLNNWLELIGTGVEKSGNLSQMIQDAIAGATVADTGGPALESALGAIGSALAGHDTQDRRIDDAMGLLQLYGSDNGDKLIQDFRDILGANMAKSDAYSNAIYGNTDFMKNTGLDLMEYIKGYNPLETDWGRGVLDYYGIRSGEASNAANAAGAGANGGNIDSYAAANAERQRLSTLGEGISALSGMTNSRFENLLNTFNSIGVNVNNLLGLEGQYNLPFMTSQLSEAGDLASTLYQTDADAAKAYNDDVLGLVGEGNTNAANRGTVASTASGLAGTMAQANVDAQRDKNDFVSSLINAEGELNLPALFSLIGNAGNIGANLYATDAETTANLYNYLASLYGGGVESSGTESTGSTPAAPNKSDVESYMSYMRETFPDLTDAELVTKLIEYVPEWKNSAGFLEWIASGLGADTTK
jgi:hypothetical protein